MAEHFGKLAKKSFSARFSNSFHANTLHCYIKLFPCRVFIQIPGDRIGWCGEILFITSVHRQEMYSWHFLWVILWHKLLCSTIRQLTKILVLPFSNILYIIIIFPFRAIVHMVSNKKRHIITVLETQHFLTAEWFTM